MNPNVSKAHVTTIFYHSRSPTPLMTPILWRFRRWLTSLKWRFFLLATNSLGYLLNHVCEFHYHKSLQGSTLGWAEHAQHWGLRLQELNVTLYWWCHAGKWTIVDTLILECPSSGSAVPAYFLHSWLCCPKRNELKTKGGNGITTHIIGETIDHPMTPTSDTWFVRLFEWSNPAVQN